MTLQMELEIIKRNQRLNQMHHMTSKMSIEFFEDLCLPLLTSEHNFQNKFKLKQNWIIMISIGFFKFFISISFYKNW